MYKEVVESIEGDPRTERDEASVSNKRKKRAQELKNKKEAKLDVEALTRRVRDMSVQPETEDECRDKFARQIKPEVVAEKSDEEMEDVPTKTKTEQEYIDEAWAAFDAAIAEDPTAIPKPPRRTVGDVYKMPQSTKRVRKNVEHPAEFTIGRAKFAFNLDVSFDVSEKPKYLQSQKMHYYLHGEDATTIKDLFGTLWLENHEWLIHEGYSLERVQRVQRLEISLLLKEGTELVNTRRWSIKGNFNGIDQCEAWEAFFKEAIRWGRSEALDQLGKFERRDRMKRSVCVQDDLGNLYDHTGNYWRPQKRTVHADVDAEIVLYFD